MKNNKKLPMWILVDQWHVDLEILSNVPTKRRKKLQKDVDNFLRSFLKTGQRKEYRIKVTQ